MSKRIKPAPVPISDDWDFDADIDTPQADIAAMLAEAADYIAQEQARDDEARRSYERAEMLAAKGDYTEWRQTFRDGLQAVGQSLEDFLHGADVPLHSPQAESAAVMVGRSWRTLGERELWYT
jgi:hypothetical protein